VTVPFVRYRSFDEDSGRWAGFGFRPGDIVISTRSKAGTTWIQMICALLVYRTPDLPHPLAELSPWIDRLTTPRDELLAMLDAQEHRRILKTHTPLDGVPLDLRATYVVVARHPLDAAVSLYHQAANIDRRRLARLVGAPAPDAESPAPVPGPGDLRAWLLAWIDDDTPPEKGLDRIRGVAHHLADAWSRRQESNVVLVHYQDLITDLDGEMRRIAERLGEAVPQERWPQLVEAASFGAMRARAADLVPDREGVLRDPAAFFRSGRSGAAAEVLSPAELARYRARTATLLPPDLDAWLHRT